jgi:hypothetical protein
MEIGDATLLYTSHFSRALAAITIFTIVSLGLPTMAQGGSQALRTQERQSEKLSAATEEAPVLIAQAACTTCGAELAPLTLLATEQKHKTTTVLTDSLWGNLILELAYQRDKELQKIAKRLNIVGLGTLGAIGGIAGGTLAQGIVAINVINPPAGKPDSYTPLVIGTALSSATIMVFISRLILNHQLGKQISNRQFAIKNHVEAILAHMESSGAKCASAQKELTELIGERASREWIDLYQSSHQLAMTSPRRFSCLPMPGHTD